MGCVVESESDVGASIDIFVGLFVVSFSFSFSLSLLGDIAVVGSGDLAEKENGASRLERRFPGEYIEDVDVSFSFSFSSSFSCSSFVVGVSAGIMISLALVIFPDVDADEAV